MAAISPTSLSGTDDKPMRGNFAYIVLVLLLPMALINFVAFILPVLRLGQISLQESKSGGVLTDNYTLKVFDPRF